MSYTIRIVMVIVVWAIALSGCEGDTHQYYYPGDISDGDTAEIDIDQTSPPCIAGDLNCYCHPNHTCNLHTSGEYLVCVDGLCREATCAQGSLGCGCLPGGSCNQGLFCDATSGTPRCEYPSCAIGSINCGCYPDRSCDEDADGTRLMCDGNICVRPVCTPGSFECACRPDYSCDTPYVCAEDLRCRERSCDAGNLGCNCLPDGGCNGADLFCSSNGLCETAPCPQGVAGCPCYGNGSCNGDLECLGGLCMSDDCTRGELNCACLPDGSCAYDTLTCNTSGVCKPVTCPTGSRACPCFPNNTCSGDLVCSSGVCGDVSGIGDQQPPENPVCYTPCRSDYQRPDGTWMLCSDEGLMEGCLGGSQCINGTCVMPSMLRNDASAAGSCHSDIDCPDFQTCIDGNCYSDCQYDTDCEDKHTCHRHVCRLECSADEDSCPDDYHCFSDNGSSGVCMPMAMPEGSADAIEGDFELLDEILSFTNASNSGEIILRNNADRSLEFTIKKIQQTWYDHNGFHNLNDNPLSWMEIGPWGNVQQQNEVSFLLDGNGAEKRLIFLQAHTPQLRSWQGIVEVSNPHLGKKRIQLSYVEVPEGRWQGSMFYFANFGDDNLQQWTDGKNLNLDPQEYSQSLEDVGNAFIQKWGLFRKGWISYDEISAALNSVIEGTWNYESVRSVCPYPDGACFLYDNPAGYVEFTTDRYAVPVPSGAMEFSLSMNLKQDEEGEGRYFSGKINSEDTLHFPGDPSLSLRYRHNPADGENCSANAFGACITHVESMEADVYVGGRLMSNNPSECHIDYRAAETPWLLEDFLGTSYADDASGQRYVSECRHHGLPYGDNPDEESRTYENAMLSSANPVPDGSYLHRRIELVDGALINQEDLILIFRETSTAFAGQGNEETFATYGIIRLKRVRSQLKDEDYQGWAAELPQEYDPKTLSATCSQDIIEEVLGDGARLNASTAADLARAMVTGEDPVSDPAEPILEYGDEQVHYFCEDTGLIDGGPEDDGSDEAIKQECPIGSRVQYFTVMAFNNGMPNQGCDQIAIANLACQSGEESCQETLNDWVANNRCSIRMNPAWRCENDNDVYCDEDRLDLREGKIFYQHKEGAKTFLPVRPAMADAFRYKIRFRSRSGSNVGFTPEVCIPNSDAIPYCYAPGAIDHIRQRVDCAMEIFNGDGGDWNLSQDDAAMLRDFLDFNFALDEETGDYGFEALYAELLIMLGDEEYTRSFSSRFDLAGQYLHSFNSFDFEQISDDAATGLALSGGAGYSMHSLYKAAQYYGLALNRFYTMSADIFASIEEGGQDADRNFISQQTVTLYFDKLIRASTRRIDAWSEIAKNYQNFNRADLARAVIERAYLSAYLESAVFTRMMSKTIGITSPEAREQIRGLIVKAQRSYGIALMRMREQYEGFSDEVSYFGYAPDYVPFPALDPADTNAFDKTLAQARRTLDAASEKEVLALSSTREFDTDQAAFQAELVSIKQSYESRLAEICGNMEGDDGAIYPAIPRYSHLNEKARLLGNPCGFSGNGELHEQWGELQIGGKYLGIAVDNLQNLISEIGIEKERVEEYCDEVVDFADYMMKQASKQDNLKNRMAAFEMEGEMARWAAEEAYKSSTVADCFMIVGTATGGNCPQKMVAKVAYKVASGLALGAYIQSQVMKVQAKKDLQSKERWTAYWETVQDCDYAKIDSDAKTKTLALDMTPLSLEIHKAALEIQQTLSRIDKLKKESDRLIDQWAESDEMAINVEAARNNPNIRIYKNDAVIAADRTFERAMKAAYKATKVYEYYTSQSYAYKDQLFLIRMASHGQDNLEQYLADLEDTFIEFEELYGNPDTRVMAYSLRDDILDIPRYDEKYQPYSEATRVSLFRDALNDPGYRDGMGRFVAPFNTALTRLSPLTSNHKILYVEAEIIGSDIGDSMGRVYLRQRGTGVVEGLDGETGFYVLPERTAVINPFFNGKRWWVFSADQVFRNERLRDRPMVNTRWELVLDTNGEYVNRDINLNSLSDVRILFYYTDFTEL